MVPLCAPGSDILAVDHWVMGKGITCDSSIGYVCDAVGWHRVSDNSKI